jgi:CubicO group peptidase (beta-lactamase class C family)
MTSGIPQSYVTQLWTDQDDRALERTVRLLETARLNHPVGESFAYSNANYETLGLIVQAVSGRSYEDYVREKIFGPLDMRNSFASQDEAMHHGMASGYRWWFGIPVPVTLAYKRAELPAGYLISSAEDMTHYLIAQMNAGRYRDTAVLSPDGISFTHSEPMPGRYGIGWETLRVNGRRLINHDGGTANFQSSLFFDPNARVGVILLANVINALDAFASPHGTSPLDGQTTRAMARTVLSLATNQPLPDTRPGHERLTLLFNVVILALTGALVASLARIRGRHRLLAQRGIPSWSDLARRSGLAAVTNFAVPAAVLYLLLGVPAWRALILFQPDLGYWLDAVALVLFLKGLLELAVIRRVFERPVNRADIAIT